jgi:hypothetical protein
LRKWVKHGRAKILMLVALPFAVAGCRSAVDPRAKSPDIRHVHPIPGTDIVRFEELDEGVYNGSRPKTDADYEFLQSKGVRYIVDLKLFPWLYRLEANRARAYGITVIPATINASPVTPSEAHVNYVLCLLHDKRYRPIYFHCDLGRDRAMLIVGLYDMYYRGMSKEEAWKHMKHYGFKDDWTLHGLKNYFETHSKSPLDKYIPDCTRVRHRPLPTPASQAETRPCGAN